MKKFISVLLLSSFLIQSQAKASFMVFLGSVLVLNGGTVLVDAKDSRLKTNIVITNVGMVLFTTAMVAFVSAAGGPMWVPGIFASLSEDGSIPAEELEIKLAERYSFIVDREAIHTLTLEIIKTAEGMEFDDEGKKMVSISEERVKEILSPLEINEEDIQIVVNDLK